MATNQNQQRKDGEALMETEAYYAFHAHKNKVLLAKSKDDLRDALENLDERMLEFFDTPPNSLTYAAIFSAIDQGYSFKHEVADYLAIWEGKLANAGN